MELPLHAKAVLKGVGRADVRIEAGEVGGQVVEVRAGERILRILDLDGVKDDAVVKYDGGGEVSAGAIVEDSCACAEDGLSFPGRVCEGDARGEVVVVVKERLPVVADAD